MVLTTLMALAAAEDAPRCDDAHEAPPDALSVAWVSRLGARARAGSWLAVVPTADLRAATTGGSVARLLQVTGHRRSSREPRRRYKVVVFDVSSDQLCRPVSGVPTGQPAAGVIACDERRSQPSRSATGCGHTVDRSTGGTGVPAYASRWSDLAGNGFCVLPAERFVAR